MSKRYFYRLGIDLGISSIGTGLIRLQDGKLAGALDGGVRIFPISDGAAERTEKRRARKNARRTKKRLMALTTLLQDNGLFPKDLRSIHQLNKRSVYAIRSHGARHKLNDIYELSRAILHLAKHRGAGFVSEMDEATEDGSTRETGKTSAYDIMRNNVAQMGPNATLGEYLCSRIRRAKSLPVRQRKQFIDDNMVDYAIPRYLVRQEFQTIWETQARHYPALTDALFTQIRDVLFFEHPHAPYAVGLCPYFPNERRIPRMHPLAVERRMYEQVNNLRVEKDRIVQALDREQRDTLIHSLMRGEALTRTGIKKILGFPHQSSIRMPGALIDPWPFEAAFEDCPAWEAMDWGKRTALIEYIAEPTIEGDEGERLLPESELIAWICRQLQTSEHDAAMILAKLPKGHSSLGQTATAAILTKLREGATIQDGAWRPISQREAADLCGYEAEEERARRLQNTYDILPYYGEILTTDTAPVHPWHKDRACPEEATFGRIANPAVHVALNQLRRVINNIILLYGKPQAIHIELAREFGKSKKKREELEAENNARREDNDRIADAIRQLGKRPSRNKILKYRLWEEQKYRDPFTLKNIGNSELFSMEIEHLIPRARGGSDSPANLVLVDRNSNAGKGDQYPFEFLSGRDNWAQILKNAKDTLPRKAWRFMHDARERYEAEGDMDETDRLLQDTSYIAKMAARYLRAVCADVLPVKGGYTAKMRHAWGLDGLEYDLLGLTVPKEISDPKTGEVHRNPEWKAKARIDQRHHAIDAVVVACINRRTVQQLGTAYNHDLKYDFSQVPAPWGKDNGTFRRSLLEAMKNVKVSFKPDHSPQGELHEATARWVLGPSKQDGRHLVRYNRSFNALTTRNNVEKLPFTINTIPLDTPELQADYEHLCTIRDNIQTNYEQAKKKLEAENQEREAEQKRPLKINERNIVMRAVRLTRSQMGLPGTYPQYDNIRLAYIRPEGHGYIGGNNHRMDFYARPNGAVGWEIISTFNAMQQDFVPQWRQADLRPLWSLRIGDVIEMDCPEELSKALDGWSGRVLFKVRKMSAGKLSAILGIDARQLTPPPKSPDYMSQLVKLDEKGLSYWCKHRARKVDLSPFGKVMRKHRRLWHGKFGGKA